ncbi:histidinol-phosphate transaminase [Konateibacter massiliensis]|uniref:histidinol-phosphate transaminase n=1 Tax=Konateibacter massiliensis TaxID=2002841 RepID=UPI000C15B179|nr:histidinol-phosphate transaminase [Konateibacter massiliensis]
MAWQDNVRKVVPYVPGEQPESKEIIKLNTNENPYPPSDVVKKTLQEFGTDDLRLYPSPSAAKLVKALADYHGVKEENVFVGVGSDDVIGMAFLTFFNSDKPILFPDVSYSFYSVWADLFQIPYERPMLDEAFRLVKEDYYKENGGIIIPNPNAPTAIYEELSVMEDIISHNRDVVVMIDEAYIDFGGKSALELVEKYDNLLVIQTYSKSRSMAGIRIGYAIGSKELIACLNAVKNSYNSYTINSTAIAAGVASLQDKEYFEAMIDKVVATRERMKGEMARLGFDFTDSKANFLFASHGKMAAKDIFEALREKEIYVRYFNIARIDNYLRISIGTDEEMDKLLEALEQIVSA